MNEIQLLNQAVQSGHRAEANALTRALLDQGLTPLEVVERGLMPAMAVVGEKFKNGEAFVPEMLIAARAMKESMGILEPLLTAAGIKPRYKAVIGTVQGDLHDIGKNLVAAMWKGASFAVVDLGVNVPPEQFVAAVREHQPQVMGMSALLTTTMPAMRTTISAVRKAGFDTVRILVGGAPVSADFALEIGADGYAPDAPSAVDQARRLIAASMIQA